MSKCKACGGTYRKGTRALVHFPQGTVSTTVCPKCAAKGLLLVARALPPVIQEKRERNLDVERVIRMLKTYAAAAIAEERDLSRKEDDMAYFMAGRAEGIQCAIQTIRREMGE